MLQLHEPGGDSRIPPRTMDEFRTASAIYVFSSTLLPARRWTEEDVTSRLIYDTIELRRRRRSPT